MGLPLFITPVESEATSKAKEPIASPSRTSIRRARLSRGQHARTLDASRRRQALRMFENDTQAGRESSRISRSPPDVEEMMRGYADYELSRAFGRTGSAQEPDGRHTLQARMRRFAQERQRRESEALGPRDTPSFERQQVPGEPDGPLMPPAPEPRDFAATIGERQRVRDLRRMARRHAAPTPPNAEEDRVSIDTSEDTQPTEGNTVLSNERTGSRPLPETGRGIWNAFERLRNSDADMLSPNDPETGRRQYARRPWSNMVERERARRRPGQARLDGLGDRDRSLSPLYNDQEPMWETLLTSITPDPQPPSAGSSFASSSAAAAASSSNSMPQSMTSSMTSVDRTEDDPMNQECDMSDSNDGSDWDAEDGEGAADNTDALTRGGERLWRTYADVVTARDGPTRRIASRDTEHLGGMHRIISRLVERDDIPDEWWAGAGLVRREPSS